jgi:hypothetical protein
MSSTKISTRQILQEVTLSAHQQNQKIIESDIIIIVDAFQLAKPIIINRLKLYASTDPSCILEQYLYSIKRTSIGILDKLFGRVDNDTVTINHLIDIVESFLLKHHMKELVKAVNCVFQDDEITVSFSRERGEVAINFWWKSDEQIKNMNKRIQCLKNNVKVRKQ